MDEQTPNDVGSPSIANQPRILDRLATELDRAGLVPEVIPTAQIVYLASVTRLHRNPVSVAVRGVSSAGKSWLTALALSFQPPEAYYARTAMSPKALAYSDEPMTHRHLILYEAQSLKSGDAAYLVRSLLSEGKVIYETVESTKDGLKPKLIEKPGPTGLITTSTAITLDTELETRLLSVTVPDTPQATRAVLLRWGEEAQGGDIGEPDTEAWHEFGRSLAEGETEVALPYGVALAKAMPDTAVRLRRDFKQVTGMVRAHALLHRATRERDAKGRIVATPDDYHVVRELLEPVIAQGIDAGVSDGVREVVEAVARLVKDHGDGVSQAMLVAHLGIDKAAVSRRVKSALSNGYLRNLEDRRGHASRLVPGEPLPGREPVLPMLDRTTPTPLPKQSQHVNGSAGVDELTVFHGGDGGTPSGPDESGVALVARQLDEYVRRESRKKKPDPDPANASKYF